MITDYILLGQEVDFENDDDDEKKKRKKHRVNPQ